MEGADLELFERSLRHATENHSGPSLDAALEELGWNDALTLDPRAAISTFFELQGLANVCSAALDEVLLNALDLESAPTAGVVLPALDGLGPPGERHGERLAVRGLGTAALADRAQVVIVAAGDDTDAYVAAVVPTASLALRPIQGIDPWLGLVEVTGEARPDRIEPARWLAALARGRLAIGHELTGASRQMLELARQHALERIQFGQPISRFQAVRHRLAETLVAIETAEAVLDAAWQDHSPQTAAMAKAVAGRRGRVAVRHCQQVLAGIGFTAEHAFHHYAKRVLVLDQLLGSSRQLTKSLGDDLLAKRQLPALLPL
jgi:hypothetical protein